jgi:hypothetical protein
MTCKSTTSNSTTSHTHICLFTAQPLIIQAQQTLFRYRTIQLSNSCLLWNVHTTVPGAPTSPTKCRSHVQQFIWQAFHSMKKAANNKNPQQASLVLLSVLEWHKWFFDLRRQVQKLL